MRNTKSRNSLGRSQDDYQIDAFLYAKGKKMVANIETAIDDLLNLWRVS